MTPNTREWAPNADEQSMSDRLPKSRGGAGLADDLGEIDEIDETLNREGIAAARRPHSGEMSDLELARLTERPRPEVKTYAPGEATPLDELLNAQPEAPAANATALGAEVARLQSVVNRLARDIAKAEARYEELDDSRADVVLNGGNIEELHNELRNAEELGKTLTAGLVPARAMLAKAQAAAAAARLERTAAEVKAKHHAPAAEALQTMYTMLSGVVHAAKVLEEHATAIGGANLQAIAAGRQDLVVDMNAIRLAVIDTIGTERANIQLPTRMGETDAQYEARLLAAVASIARMDRKTAKAKGKSPTLVALCKTMQRVDNEDAWAAVALVLNQPLAEGEGKADHHKRLRDALAMRLNVNREGESDEAYLLRVANAHAAIATVHDQSDPLRAVGEKALKAIQAHALGLEKTALHRQYMNVRELKPLPGDTDIMHRIGRRS
ncbi:hypothetical protein ACVINZ_001602 [Mesorhizobium jarvisii]